ncbi:PQQ-binding-like beta-propeller repeat protein [candidate division KSB1 bacterium]|nr:PQQ-binding-like beta-propeller repeat protein [candidate division KSB1 bacterium]
MYCLNIFLQRQDDRPLLPAAALLVLLFAALSASGQTSGSQKWAFKTGNSVDSSPAVGADGTIYIGSDDDNLYALDSSSPGLAKSFWPKFRQNRQNTGRIFPFTISSCDWGYLSLEENNSYKRNITCRNLTGNPVVIQLLDLDNSRFAISKIQLPYTLPAGDSIHFEISFTASRNGDIGSKVTAQLTVAADTLWAVGYHDVQWGGKDEYGSAVSSGVYIYQIRAGSFIQSRKMLLIQ